MRFRRRRELAGAAVLVAAMPVCAALLDVHDDHFVGEVAPDAAAGDDGVGAGDGPNGLDGGGALDATPTCDADLMIDQRHCGACNHDCANGECAGGVCTLARPLSGAKHVAVRSGFVYIALANSTATNGIARCPTKGCVGAAPREPLTPGAGVV